MGYPAFRLPFYVSIIHLRILLRLQLVNNNQEETRHKKKEEGEKAYQAEDDTSDQE